MKELMLRGSAPYLAETGLLELDSLPYLMLNMPFSCNYRCLKCCNLRTEPELRNERQHLSNEDIQALVEEASNSGFKVLVLAGEGEPSLSKEFKDIVALASRNGLLPYIFTNGSLLDDENINFLAEHRAVLIVSLDSIQPLRYNRLTGGKGNLEKALSNIERCRSVYSSLQEQSSFGKIVSLAINTVATQINIDEIEDIKHMCSDDIVFVCNRPTRIGLAEENWQSLYGNDTVVTEVDGILEKLSATNGPLGTTPDGKWCAYMKHGVSVGYDGSFLACAYATDTAGWFGNYKKGLLKQMNKEVMNSVELFYEKFGHSRCVLRHPNYQEWILSNHSRIGNGVCLANVHLHP